MCPAASPPVLVLTGTARADAEVELLDAGADDYVTKPFRMEELKARLRVLVRRSRSRARSSMLVVGDLRLDTADRRPKRLVWRCYNGGMSARSSTTLYCFSPPVMLATFTIEIILALYALWRYRQTTVRTLVIVLLLMLALFQLAEYFVCGGLGASAFTWSRVGYGAITVLPPLGLTLVDELGPARHRLGLVIAWVAAAALVGWFALAPASVNVRVCAGNYVIFHLQGWNGWWYGLYYYGVIMMALMAAAGNIETAGRRTTQTALRWFVGGVLAFLVPTATVNILNPKTLQGIPSIMCGFAVLFALVLALRILPLTTERR